MNHPCADLITALKTPLTMSTFTLAQWDRIIPQARAAGLLGRLAALATHSHQITCLPKSVWHALEAGLILASRQAVNVRYELRQLDAALLKLGRPVLVLKGAAYIANDSPASAGRLMTDIDILVDKRAIGEAEAALMLAGWMSSHHDAYDQRYYRQWMHEIPPMQHIRRGTIVDVHHNLLPETARIQTRPDLIIASAVPLPGMVCLHVPSELDMILHSATHLMHEGEWHHGLRDLSDLYSMIMAASAQRSDFWVELENRACELQLERPLFLVLQQLNRIFDLEIPLEQFHKNFSDFILQGLLTRGVYSFHSSCRTALTSLSELMLYVRSHWLRMSLPLLVPHLIYKAVKAPSDNNH